MTQPIDLYYWPTPNGWKISIALEEMGLPYTLHPVAIGKDEQFAPDFLKVSPNNKIPAIIDPDGPGGQPISIFESGAILNYLARKTGQFGASDARHQVEIDQWLMWQMGGVGPMAGQAHHFLKYAPEDLPYARQRYVNEVARLYRVLDNRLSDRRFIAGDAFTIADMATWPWASLWEGQNQTLDDKPHLARWLEEVFARPGVQRGRAVMKDRRNDPKPDRYGKRL
ncbi:glutathione S-transferase N-terminal domain-containing protein [Mesobacterium sp. TK19101]|uniref:Glutathione S-transferase N-terminal domain-containing protein n=1 Tax=Mesobacterium hydrothermale TaxID=3111907 RepID=A0ABU6HKK0_9RHOB|nr:glutathione S-transferase N-terminal domain-containing protein [Mesobacterium sp. TK19101]MEC3861968.1 glutathione S-transferase N-terminal domain-containing protein [Mesobacterium sp. TK19101]